MISLMTRAQFLMILRLFLPLLVELLGLAIGILSRAPSVVRRGQPSQRCFLAFSSWMCRLVQVAVARSYPFQNEYLAGQPPIDLTASVSGLSGVQQISAKSSLPMFASRVAPRVCLSRGSWRCLSSSTEPATP